MDLTARALEISTTLLGALVLFFWKAQAKRNERSEERLREIEIQVAKLEEKTNHANKPQC
jgi:hypothetical protein